jgi:hypothetical protein
MLVRPQILLALSELVHPLPEGSIELVVGHPFQGYRTRLNGGLELRIFCQVEKEKGRAMVYSPICNMGSRAVGRKQQSRGLCLLGLSSIAELPDSH